MSLDGAYLHLIKTEIAAAALGARIDRIAQPSREEIVLGLRGFGRSMRLLISTAADSARILLTESRPENPAIPPMFCMLLRKLLGNAKLTGVRQLGLDRILFLDFETTNELGDKITLTLAVELMGRYSNLIILDSENRILDAIRRVDAEMSAVRQILPGMTYALPPQQEKLNLLQCDAEEAVQRIRTGRDAELSKAVMNALQGLSPLNCREIAHYTTHGLERLVSQLTEDQFDRLRFFLKNLIETLREGKPHPTLLREPGGKPRDFSFLEVRQYGHTLLTQPYESCSALLDAFFAQRAQEVRMRQRGGDLLRLLANTSERITRKLALQTQELAESTDREKYHIYGDLLHANLYAIPKGAASATVQNFYDEAMGEITIPLDPALSPAQNAQRYYARYRRADNAEKKLRELIEQGKQDLEYIDSVFDALTRAGTENELIALREELAAQGYGRYTRAKNKKPVRLSPVEYRSSDGYTILVGRNNTQNDQLTLRQARNYDLWLHAQKMPGAHVVVLSQGGEFPDRTVEEAAVIAACNSKGREAGTVPVDYTLVKNVKKPRGAKPGMVIYVEYKTAYVAPDADRARALLADCAEGKTASCAGGKADA